MHRCGLPSGRARAWQKLASASVISVSGFITCPCRWSCSAWTLPDSCRHAHRGHHSAPSGCVVGSFGVISISIVVRSRITASKLDTISRSPDICKKHRGRRGMGGRQKGWRVVKRERKEEGGGGGGRGRGCDAPWEPGTATRSRRHTGHTVVVCAPVANGPQRLGVTKKNT